MFNIFRDTIAKDLTKIADKYNAKADAGTIFKDKRALAVNRIKNAVLNGDIGGGGGVTPEIEAEIENAQWKTETSTPLFNESVTTVTEGDYATANLTYAQEITSDVLSVVFNDTKYTCYRNEFGGYGGAYNEADDTYDFSEYPFTIKTSMNSNAIFTAEPGTYNISASYENITYTDEFKEGVAKNTTFYVDFVTSLDAEITANRTFGEILSAYNNGAVVLGRYNTHVYNIARVEELFGSVQGINFSNIEYVPDDDVMAVKLITATPEGFNYYGTEISVAPA